MHLIARQNMPALQAMFPEVMNFVLPDAASVKLFVMSTQLYWGSLAPKKTGL